MARVASIHLQRIRLFSEFSFPVSVNFSTIPHGQQARISSLVPECLLQWQLLDSLESVGLRQEHDTCCVRSGINRKLLWRFLFVCEVVTFGNITQPTILHQNTSNSVITRGRVTTKRKPRSEQSDRTVSKVYFWVNKCVTAWYKFWQIKIGNKLSVLSKWSNSVLEIENSRNILVECGSSIFISPQAPTPPMRCGVLLNTLTDCDLDELTTK